MHEAPSRLFSGIKIRILRRFVPQNDGPGTSEQRRKVPKKGERSRAICSSLYKTAVHYIAIPGASCYTIDKITAGILTQGEGVIPMG